MISQDSSYVGQAELNHYAVRDTGFSLVPFSMPKRPQDHGHEMWYAVARGRAIGIYRTW